MNKPLRMEVSERVHKKVTAENPEVDALWAFSDLESLSSEEQKALFQAIGDALWAATNGAFLFGVQVANDRDWFLFKPQDEPESELGAS